MTQLQAPLPHLHALRYRETWGLILARFTGDGAFYFCAFWLPNYLHSERDFDIGRIAWVAALPFVAADLGALFAIQVKQASLFAVPTDLFPARDVGAVWGLSGAAGSLAAAFAQPVIGWLIDHYSYTPVFVIVSFMHIVSALMVTVLIRRVEPVQLRGLAPGVS